MAKPSRYSGRAPAFSRPPENYARLSSGPLHCLLFLLPLVICYEIGLVVYLSSQDGSLRETILAYSQLDRLFKLFGASSLYMPGILMVVMLLIWQILSKQPWRVRPAVLGGMACESILWMIPLLVLGLITSMSLSGGHAAMAVQGTGIHDSWQARVVLSIGAGLYEEMLFRLLFVTLLHMVFHDAIRLTEGPASLFAILGSAIAFTVYHDVSFFGGSPISSILFYMLAGAYFGVVFLMRGFGIVVGTHAAYDIMVLVVLPMLRR